MLALESLLGEARWLSILRPVAVAGVLVLLWRHYDELHGRIRLTPRHAVLAIGLGVAIFATWIAFERGWATVGNERGGFDPRGASGQVDWVLATLRLAGFGLVVPVMEELFWRSFLLRWIASPKDFLALDPRRAGFVAFALTSALFASEHSLWFAGLVAGAAYAFVYMRVRNLWAAVLSHAVTNTTLGVWILATGDWHLW